MDFPDTQGKLIRAARADRTQAQFAQVLRVDRSCLSRYERGTLGAPTAVIDFCLTAFAKKIAAESGQSWQFKQALELARETVAALEHIAPLNPIGSQTRDVKAEK